MKLKNVFLSVGMFIFALGMFGLVSSAEAYTRTAAVSGPWGDFTTWGAPVPTSADAVVIPNNIVVTVDVAAVASSVTIQNASSGVNGITISGSNSLTVGGAVTMAASTGAASTIAVGAGTLTIGTDLTITGNATHDSAVTVGAGTLVVGGDLSFAGTDTHAKLTMGASTLRVGGDFLPVGGLVTPGTSTLTMNGSSAQVLGLSTTEYNNVIIANTSGGVTIDGQVTIPGTLVVNAGTFNLGSQQLTVTGATTIANGGTISLDASTNKTFNGAVTIQSGGALTETAAATLVFGSDLSINSGGVMTEVGAAITSIAGSLQVNASGGYVAGTGVHTFSGTAQSISGYVTIPSVKISGSYSYSSANTFTAATLFTVDNTKTFTNTGTVTVGALSGDGEFINGAGGVLNIGGVADIVIFNATSDTNTVNYTGAAQTVKDGTNHEYGHLGLSGSGDKVITAATLIAGNLTIAGTAKASLSGTANTANKLYFGTSYQRNGTWGNTGSGATHINTTYFANTGRVAVTLGHSVTSTTTTTDTPASTTTTTPAVTTTVETTTTTPVVTPVVTEVAGGCSGGNVFNTSTGKPCSNNTTVTSKKVYALGQTTLKNGSKGEAVKELQRFLNDKLSLGLVVDGKLGPKTIAVIKQWQKDNGLVADGLVGAKTKAMMNK